MSDVIFNYLRKFITNKWYNILESTINKYKNDYHDLENIDIKNCSYKIENEIYTNCVHQKNNQLKFYVFCQMYIYIYLTNIFKDVYIENFLLHIYNSYIQNNIKNIIHCHDYILKNIIYFDCSDNSEIIKYNNLINSNVQKLSDYTIEEFKIRVDEIFISENITRSTL